LAGPVLLIDTHSLVYRAHYVAPPALLGFTAHVESLRKKWNASRVVFAVDLPKPTFRSKMCEHYKAGRRKTPRALVDEFQKLHAHLETLDGEFYFKAGFEADDILATLAKELRARGERGLVASGDRDLVALAYGGIEVLIIGRYHRDTTCYDAAAVERRFGVKPQQFSDWLALNGDRADSMPGVPGLGPKVAARLLRQWGTVGELLEHLDGVQPPGVRRQVEQHAERVRLNARVMALRDDVPLR